MWTWGGRRQANVLMRHHACKTSRRVLSIHKDWGSVTWYTWIAQIQHHIQPVHLQTASICEPHRSGQAETPETETNLHKPLFFVICNYGSLKILEKLHSQKEISG